MIPSRLAILRAASPWQRFMNNRPGVVYTPYNPKTLRTSRASGPWHGVNVGGLVGAMRDVSRPPGLGNDAVAVSDAARMTLDSFGSGTGAAALRGNGSSTAMQSASAVDLSASPIATCIVVVRKLNGTNTLIVETGPVLGTTNGTLYVANAEATGDDFSVSARGTLNPNLPPRVTGFTAPASAVIVGTFELGRPLRSIAVNRGTAATSGNSMGSGNFTEQVLNIGSRNGNSLWFNGQIGTIALIGGSLSAAELDTAIALASGPYGI